MTTATPGMHPELEKRIRDVVKRCRRTRWVHCWTRFGLIAFGLTCLFTLLLAMATPDGPLGGAIFLLFTAGLLLTAWSCLLRPLRKPITLRQVALFIDEHHPELENRIVSAVEFSATEPQGASAWIVERFLEETTPILRKTSLADLLDSKALAKPAFSALLMLAASTAVLVVFSGLWLPSLHFALPDRVAGLIAPPFTVEPGDRRVRRGDNQMVWLKTGLDNRKAVIRWRVPGASWAGGEMDRSGSDNVYYHQFTNVQSDIQYQVQLGRRRSKTFKLTAWTPPEIDSIDLTYHYPEYLGLDSREVPNGGNITAIEGTRVDLAVWVNKKLNRAELVLEGGARFPLDRGEESQWTTQITLTRDDTYHIELTDREEAPSEYDPEYAITVQRDKPPEIRIDFPRGDREVTMLEEIPFDFSVSDDFGFADFGIQYQVAGKEPVRVALNGTGAMTTSAEGHHQMMLEDLDLESGDFITWTVWAKDGKPDRNAYAVLGDPYFLEIRPFHRRYEEAISGGSGRGGGQGDEDPTTAQKDIIIATWNLRREAARLEAAEFDERRDIIVETQDQLLRKLSSTGGLLSQPTPEMIRLREAMENAIQGLEGVQLPHPETALTEVTVHEQQAYRMLLKLMPTQWRVQQTRSGGSGGRRKQRPDISALEMDRNRNFYEDENLTRQEQEAARQILNKIKELARRQQIANEEIADLISELQNAESAQERERLRRRLERLEDELQRNLDTLDEIRKDLASGDLSNERAQKALESLQEARRQMNRSLEQLREEKLQQARSAGTRAGQALGDIRHYLQQFSGAAAAQRMRELLEEMNELTERQRGILRRAETLEEQNRSPSFDVQEQMREGQQGMLEDKEQLAEAFIEMMNDAGDLADRAAQTQELMARKLGDWLRETSRKGILEEIEESELLVQYGVWDSALEEERAIARKLDEAEEKLKRVAQHLVEDDLEGMQKALEHLDGILSPRQTGGQPGKELAKAGATGQAADAQDDGENPSDGPQRSEPSGTPGGTSASGTRSGTSLTGGDRFGPLSEDGMADFARSGYQQWLEELRNAEALLPRDSRWRGRVARIREEVETIRRIWRERALAPQFDLFLKMVARPLKKTVEGLQGEIQRRLHEKEFVLVDSGDIPEKYRERVADYFKDLSESEGNG